MTIYEIKRLTAETSPYYFSRATLKFFYQRLKDFKVSKESDGRYLVQAPISNGDHVIGKPIRHFNPKTNKLEVN